MDVIESLKRKTEEEAEPTEEWSEGEADEMEENPDPTSGNNETAGSESSKNADVKEDLQNPPAKCKQKRASKRRKVDAGESASYNDNKGEESKISAEKPDGSNGDSEVGKTTRSMVPKGSNEDLPSDKDVSMKQIVGVQTRSMKTQAVADEGESPSSTLHLQSSDEDFE